MIRTICGEEALIDAADEHFIIAHRWRLMTRRLPSGREYIYVCRITPEKHMVLLHREITDAGKGMHVDHINGDTLDNRRSNLRVCTNSQNQANRIKSTGFSSQYKGVRASGSQTNPWEAVIHIDGKTIYLGRYSTEEKAAIAYDLAAYMNWGQYARLNTLVGQSA